MSDSSITLVSCIPSTLYVEFFDNRGKSYKLRHDSPLTAELVKETAPYFIQGLSFEISASVFISGKLPSNQENLFSQFSKKTGGKVRFFRVIREKLSSWFSCGKLAPEPVQIAVGVESHGVTPEKLLSAAALIMQDAHEILADTSVSDDEIANKTSTIVAAVVSEETGETVLIPEAEKLDKLINASVTLGSVQGMEAFFQRMARVVENRGHSIQDLLRFLERADLPIADDGSIIAYKVLTSAGNRNHKYGPGYYYDCHSRNVPQKVGSLVMMAEDMVDPDRRNDCSHGLHIARRGYIGGFSGDVIVLCKINPEDVIAVPQYDSNKVRVCAYHIINEIPKNLHGLLRSNKPFTSDKNAAFMVGAAIVGKHVGILETTTITGNYGGGIILTKISDEEQFALSEAERELVPEVDAVELDTDAKEKPNTVESTAIAEKDITKIIKEAKASRISENSSFKEAAKTPSAPARNSAVQDLLEKLDHDHATAVNAANTLIVLKRTRKVSWTKMGVPLDKLALIENLLNSTAPETANQEEEVMKQEETKGTPAQEARKLFEKKDWSTLWMLKNKRKKSWAFFGFTDKEVESIIRNKPSFI